jgi:subtilisin family serine protease
MERYYFAPHPAEDGARDGEEAEATGLIALPAEVLQRHGAMVLDPARAAATAPHSSPRSTVYRAKALLIPADLAQNQGFVRDANKVLGPLGMNIVLPGAGEDDELTDWLPRTAVLVPAPGRMSPVVVDAWVALQALRAAAATGKFRTLTEKDSREITLDHLLTGSAIEGAPAHGGGGAEAGGTGLDAAGSYTFSGGDTRMPVAVLVDPPARGTAGASAAADRRRPVVAVIDTGMRCHEWLDVKAKPGGGYQTEPDGFVVVDPGIQKAIQIASEQAAAAGDTPRLVIRDPWDAPVSANPLIGELDTHIGHGTFIAGIVRQIAPEARVLAIRAMFSDGIVYESVLICALGQLAARIARAGEGDPDGPVVAVSLSLGYFCESAEDVAFSSGLWQVIKKLLSLRVTVVAAAGNFATSRRFYPAAFATRPVPAGHAPLISVGALNPDGTKAIFSDDGCWVNTWAIGAAVMSTYPTDIKGSRAPQLEVDGHPRPRAAFNPDDYEAGFALWAGTSFAAPVVAAYLARELLAAEPGPAPEAKTYHERTPAALARMGWPG